MNLDLTGEKAAAPIRELAAIIDGNRYQFSQRIRTLKAILRKLHPEPACQPLPRRRCMLRCEPKDDVVSERSPLCQLC
jgi:hypothetical protein